MSEKIKIVILIVSIILILLLATLSIIQVNQFITREYLSMQQLDKGIYHHVYKYDWNTKEGIMLVQIADPDNGIDKITCPDGTILECYGKTQVAIDWNITNNNSYTFNATTNSAETLQQEIIINEQTVEDLITFDIQEENTNLTFNIDYKQYEHKYYKFSENGEWISYNGEFSILAEDVVKQGGYNEENKTSVIYLKGTDDVGNEVIIKQAVAIKAEMPKVNIIFRNAEKSVDMNTLKQQVKDELAKNNISAGLMEVAIGGEQILQSNSDDAQTIFNTWGRVGYTGKWYYDSSTKTIINSENTGNYTGFYYAQQMDFTDIELSYNNMSTNGDDDVMGAMIRFNRNSNGTVTTYIFALDKHDSNGGINNGAYNGLLKITGKSFAAGNVQLLQKINKVWSRNEWTNYRIVAKDNNIKVYMNNELVINYTDNSNPILTGSYGFFSYSQPYAMYKDIEGRGFKPYTIQEVIEDIDWNKTTNCIINVNYEEETELTQELADNMIEYGIYYIGVTIPEHQLATEEFITLNQEKGTYINGQDENMVSNIVDYIKTII